MREYGQIQCSFWTDPEIQALSDASARLATYLLTGPHSNGLGCYRLPDGYIQADFGWTPQMVSKAFQELFQMGFCQRCETTQFVLMPKFLRWNPIANANVAKAREKEFDTIPKKASIRGALVESMIEFADHLSEAFRNRLETLSKQNPTRSYPEPDPEPDPIGKGAPTGGPPKKAKAKRGTRLPDDFPTDDELLWATENHPGIDHNLESAKFRDYWNGIPGQKGVKLDWPATWRNWVRNAVQFKGKANGSKPKMADDYSQKTYEGTPDDELPAALR